MELSVTGSGFKPIRASQTVKGRRGERSKISRRHDLSSQEKTEDDDHTEMPGAGETKSHDIHCIVSD
ncbi:hypothetical protein SESBI_12397 [Sesbania bispinosa]|nr:hypothetical protein SESBI_12397 [Sesbania bispinosa]